MKRELYDKITAVLNRNPDDEFSVAGEIVLKDGRIIPKRTCMRHEFEEWCALVHEAAKQSEVNLEMVRTCENQ